MKITEKTVVKFISSVILYFVLLHGIVLWGFSGFVDTGNDRVFGCPEYAFFNFIWLSIILTVGGIVCFLMMVEGDIRFEYHIGGKSKKRDEIMKKMHKAKDKEELDLLLIELEKLR